MLTKFLVVVCFASLALAYEQVKPKEHWQEQPANYEFNYEVHDLHTGDIKRQHEKADNGKIHGEYSLVDPDGFRRVVSYHADDDGFHADVQREKWQEKPSHGLEKPAVQEWKKPAAQVWQKPAVQGWEKPTPQEWQKPAVQGWQKPAAQGWKKPASNGWEKPAAQGWQKPAVQGWEKPAAQVWEKPNGW